jgi:hypothetical protein
MSSILACADAVSILRYQEVVLLAALFNQAREEGDVDEAFMTPSPHLLVKAFANVLDNGFVPCEGELISLSRDISIHRGVVAQLRFDATKDIVNVRTWVTDHAWLCLPEFDIWIDVLPPGSDPRWLSPVKYLPGPHRPAYRATGVFIDTTKKPKQSEVTALSKFLQKLWKERVPEF